MGDSVYKEQESHDEESENVNDEEIEIKFWEKEVNASNEKKERKVKRNDDESANIILFVVLVGFKLLVRIIDVYLVLLILIFLALSLKVHFRIQYKGVLGFWGFGVLGFWGFE